MYKEYTKWYMQAHSYLGIVIKPLLKTPDAFSVIESQDAMGVLLTVRVHKEDMGVLIGKEGETAKAVRHLVRIVGMMEGARVSIKIEEPVKTG